MRPLRRVLVAAAALAAACASTGHRSAMEDVRGATAPAAPLRVFATGDTRGSLAPCGCSDGQFGGVSRRATYVRELTFAGEARRPGDLWIDLGNMTAGAEGVRRLRREATLDALAAMRYDALVPGRAEILDGLEFDAAAAVRGLRVVCANLVGSDGRPVFDPYILRVLPDGRRVAVVGIAEAVGGAPAGRTVLPPGASLRSAVDELKDRADVVIAATSLRERDARALAADVPGVALVLAGDTPSPDVAFAAAGNALLGVVGHLGEYVARVDFDAALRPVTKWRAWLGADVPDDPAAAAIASTYKQAVSALDARLVEKIVDARRKQGFAGSAACAPCHRADFETWSRSLHAVAMKILATRQSERDPDCVPCHLVDVPEPGRPLDPDAMGVGCETCHGGSAAHTADPAVKTPVRGGGKSDCAAQCHHPPEVKTFDIDVQWARIRHGGK